MERIVAYEGEKLTIAYAREADGKYPGNEFFRELPKRDQARLHALFALLADHQSTSNEEKFGNLGDGLFEFKSFQIRMPYVYSGTERGLVLISHGFIKKKDKAPKSEIERARRIIKEDTHEEVSHAKRGFKRRGR